MTMMKFGQFELTPAGRHFCNGRIWLPGWTMADARLYNSKKRAALRSLARTMGDTGFEDETVIREAVASFDNAPTLREGVGTIKIYCDDEDGLNVHHLTLEGVELARWKRQARRVINERG